MKIIAPLIVSFAIFISTSLSVKATENIFNYDRHIGIVSSERGKSILAISNKDLLKGQKVLVLYEDTNKTQKILEVKITNIINGDVPLSNSKLLYNEQLFLYEIEKNTNNGVAFILDHGISNYNKKLQSIDVDGDGNKEKLIVCTSTEGVHYIVKSVYPKKDVLRKDFYYYLGYDVEPTCTNDDYN